MAIAKKTLFGEKETKLADLAKALSHPARIQILMRLMCSELCNCCEIVEELPLAQSTVSQHLKALKKAGLIEMSAEGPKSNYKISLKAFDSAIDVLEDFLAGLRTLKGVQTCKPRTRK